jgi:hypothetical protein
MSIDKKGFRYRLSNVLAWFGFIGVFGFGFSVSFFLFFLVIGDSYDGRFEGPIIAALFFLAFYLLIGVINYLMVGSVRLLPWRDIEDQE